MQKGKEIKYVVRSRAEGDEGDLATILGECFGRITEARLRRVFRKKSEKPENVVVAEVGGKVRSLVWISPKDLIIEEDVTIRTAGIAGVCTDSDFRRRGVVTRLMRNGLERVRLSGISNTSLFTGLDLPAHRIYEKLGYFDVATTRAYTKYLDFPFALSTWVRRINERVKHSKEALRKLKDRSTSILLRFSDQAALTLKCSKGRLRLVRRETKEPDLIVNTNTKAFTRAMWKRSGYEKAVKLKQFSFEKGTEEDIELLRRVLTWDWD